MQIKNFKRENPLRPVRTGAKNLETGIPLSRTFDISKLPIPRTETSFLPSVQKCTLNFSNSPIFPADLRFPLSLQKSGFQPCNSGKKMKTFLNLWFKVKKKKRK